MSRGPLEVLREARQMLSLSIGGLAKETKQFDEAIAQIEALVEAAHGIKFDVFQITTPEMREAFDGQVCIAVVQRQTVSPIRAALAPFTPGQDSEGGHGR